MVAALGIGEDGRKTILGIRQGAGQVIIFFSYRYAKIEVDQMSAQLQVGKPGLLRQLGFVSATALVISNMVGTGIFATTGFMAGDLGDPKLILALWVVGALFALAGALSYSELGINFPSSGGEYVYLTRAYGPTWGFMTGWVSFFAGFSAPIATAALAFAYYVAYFFPSLRQSHNIGSGFFSLTLGGAQGLASLLILGFTLLNCFGVGRAAKVQNVLTSRHTQLHFCGAGSQPSHIPGMSCLGGGHCSLPAELLGPACAARSRPGAACSFWTRRRERPVCRIQW